MIDQQNTQFTFGTRLTSEQKNFYNKNGFIHFRKFIDFDLVNLFISEMQQIERTWLAGNVEKVNGTPIKYGRDEANQPIIQRFAFASQYSAVLHEFLQDDRLQALTELLQPYEGRIGELEKDGLVINHYVRTPNSNFSQMGWHTDSPRDLFLGQKIMPMLNVGLHLDDCPPENGGLRVLPGTHKQSTFKTLFRKRQFVDHKPDPNEVSLDIKAGDLTIHNGSLWHRVQQSPNLGAASRRRVMYIPIITGKAQYKNAESKTPLYHFFARKVLK